MTNFDDEARARLIPSAVLLLQPNKLNSAAVKRELTPSDHNSIDEFGCCTEEGISCHQSTSLQRILGEAKD